MFVMYLLRNGNLNLKMDSQSRHENQEQTQLTYTCEPHHLNLGHIGGTILVGPQAAQTLYMSAVGIDLNLRLMYENSLNAVN